ncbi:hypothetical protein HBH51_163470 [Parastagonospora nodorum]|nr:hypothetical protein HBH51_163470 [Parastagonospora nodorum]KAH4093482.1 hypothetical protein HBH46_175730 [Parastagonospora nodorum]
MQLIPPARAEPVAMQWQQRGAVSWYECVVAEQGGSLGRPPRSELGSRSSKELRNGTDRPHLHRARQAHGTRGSPASPASPAVVHVSLPQLVPTCMR